MPPVKFYPGSHQSEPLCLKDCAGDMGCTIDKTLHCHPNQILLDLRRMNPGAYELIKPILQRNTIPEAFQSLQLYRERKNLGQRLTTAAMAAADALPPLQIASTIAGGAAIVTGAVQALFDDTPRFGFFQQQTTLRHDFGVLLLQHSHEEMIYKQLPNLPFVKPALMNRD